MNATNMSLQSEGVKYDTGKVRMELFPPEAMVAISQILTFGAQKYADRNWEQGMSWSRVYGALLRHLMAWWGAKIRGQSGLTTISFLFGECDPETGHSHLWHAGACMVFLITYEMRGIGVDDRAAYPEDQADE